MISARNRVRQLRRCWSSTAVADASNKMNRFIGRVIERKAWKGKRRKNFKKLIIKDGKEGRFETGKNSRRGVGKKNQDSKTNKEKYQLERRQFLANPRQLPVFLAGFPLR